jgi:hypothetical protein
MESKWSNLNKNETLQSIDSYKLDANLLLNENKHRANEFLLSLRKEREKKEIVEKHNKNNKSIPYTVEEIIKDVDLGLNIKRPDKLIPPLPKENDPLYLEHDVGNYKATASLMLNKTKTINHDQTKMIKTKFKSEPNTQAESRDCKI